MNTFREYPWKYNVVAKKRHGYKILEFDVTLIEAQKILKKYRSTLRVLGTCRCKEYCVQILKRNLT